MRDSIIGGKSTGQRIEEEIHNWREEAKRTSERTERTAKRTEGIAWLALCVSIISMITQVIY